MEYSNIEDLKERNVKHQQIFIPHHFIRESTESIDFTSNEVFPVISKVFFERNEQLNRHANQENIDNLENLEETNFRQCSIQDSHLNQDDCEVELNFVQNEETKNTCMKENKNKNKNKNENGNDTSNCNDNGNCNGNGNGNPNDPKKSINCNCKFNLTNTNSNSNSLMEKQSIKKPFILNKIKKPSSNDLFANSLTGKISSKLPQLCTKFYGSTTLKVRQELQLWDRLICELKSQKRIKKIKQSKQCKQSKLLKESNQREAAKQMKRSYHTLKCNKSIIKKALKYKVDLNFYKDESFGKIREIVREIQNSKSKTNIPNCNTSKEL